MTNKPFKMVYTITIQPYSAREYEIKVDDTWGNCNILRGLLQNTGDIQSVGLKRLSDDRSIGKSVADHMADFNLTLELYNATN
jgi:hypothetical protein